MYNMTVGTRHPSVICVEISKLIPSLISLKELLASDYIEEGLQEFIESYSRTDEVLPSDKTLGFVVVNSNKKVISFSFTSLSKDVRDDLSRIGDSFKQIGYSADLDLAQ